MRILADVAPYSREYQKYASSVRHQAQDNPDLKAEYERISEQVRQTKESTLQVARKHFNAPVERIEGTVESVEGLDVRLKEYPGQTFRLSSVGGSMADLTAEMLDGKDVVPPRRAHNISRARGEEAAPRTGPSGPSGLPVPAGSGVFPETGSRTAGLSPAGPQIPEPGRVSRGKRAGKTLRKGLTGKESAMVTFAWSLPVEPK